MRVANSPFATIPLLAALTLVFVSAPRIAFATAEFDDQFGCKPMKPKMQAGYRALEASRYADAENAFTESGNEYAICGIEATGTGPALMRLWVGYAEAGILAAQFGAGKTAEALETAKRARFIFNEVSDRTPGANESIRRAASDGLAYVRSLESAKKPSLPKIWLDWKAAHPSG
jgi:hypothetical protein